MTKHQRRVILPTLLLLGTVACGRSQNEQGTPAATPEPPPAPAGTEAPVEPAGPAGPAAVPAPTAPAPTDPMPARPSPAARAQAPEPAGAPDPTVAAPAAPRPPDAPGRAQTPARDATPAAIAPPPEPPRLVSVPADTRLRLTLLTALASDTSAVEDPVSARVTAPVVIDGETVVPEGARVGGVVTYAQASGKVKGRAGLTVRFRTLTIGSRSYDITSEPLRREAQGTKSKDARNIGIGAGAGAVIGGILGGRKGAGIGAAVGGAGGTGVVLATAGEEVRLPSGTEVSTRLDAPLVVERRAGGEPR